MRYWIVVFVAGIAIGGLTSLMPGGLLDQRGDRDVADLEQLSTKKLLKKIDGKKIESIRLASEQRYAEAIDTLLYLIDINHYDQFNYVQLGRIAKEIGTDRFEELLAMTEQDRPVYDIDRIRGAVYLQTNQLKKAERYIERFLAKSDKDLAATFYKGAILRKAGRNEEAKELLSSVIKREKTYFFAYMELQELYETIGDTAMSQKMIDLATQYNPANQNNGICHGIPKLTGEG